MAITAYRLMNSTLRRMFKDADISLTPEQWGVLVLLWDRQTATQDELATALCVDKSSMSRVLSAMDDKGLITRTVDPENERKKIISATPSTQELREHGFSLAVGALANSLSGVSQEDAKTCIRVLATVKRNLRSEYG